MPYAILLSGPTGCGKTTFVNTMKMWGDFHYASTDQIILNMAEKYDSTYEEGFANLYPIAETEYLRQINTALRLDDNIIFDRTHVSEGSRKRTLQLLNPRYKKIAVYFPAYTPAKLKERIAIRAAGGGHTVPDEVIEKMHKDYKIPGYSEGFDLCVSSSEFERIYSMMDFR